MMKGKNKYLWIIFYTALLIMSVSVCSFAAMNVFLKDGQVVTVQVNRDDIIGISFDENSGTFQSKPAVREVPVTIFWHMADDADVYLNGVPLRRYEPSFKTRGDEAPQSAFSASAKLKNGDVFTVGGRRGGSYGLMLIAADQTGRVVFKTDAQKWKVYMPGDRSDWYDPSVANASPKSPVTVQPDPWYPQKELNRKYNNVASSVWGVPSETFSYLTAIVTLE